MRATGIIRRVDDFGRINIPKNIREEMEYKTGTPIEFFIDIIVSNLSLLFIYIIPLYLLDLAPDVISLCNSTLIRYWCAILSTSNLDASKILSTSII